MKKKFKFHITYFKPSGKFYTSATEEREIRVCENTEVPYMNDYCSRIRGLRDSQGQEGLPGLSGSGWDGFILVNCEEGYPCLILPPKELES